MDSVCRTCLTLGDLSPIFSCRKQHAHYTAVLFITTGLMIELDDGLPQGICKSCTTRVNSALRLRDQSHHAHQILLENGFKKSISTPEKPLRNEAVTLTENDKDAVNTDNNDSEERVKTDKEREKDIGIDISTASELLERNHFKISPSVKIERSGRIKEYSKRIKGDSKRIKEDFKIIKEDSKRIIDESEGIKLEDVAEIIEDKEFDNETIKRSDVQDVKDIISLQNSNKKVDNVKVKRKYHRKTKQELIEAAERQNKIRRVTRKERQEKYLYLVEGSYNPKGPVKCSICKKVLARISNFIPHVKRHFNGEYVCEQCGKRFHTKHSLSNHRMRLHGAEKQLQCERCEYRAVDRSQLTNHTARVHTGARPFVCDVCAADFFCKANIRQHMRSHFALKTVQCDKCPAMFNSRSSLASHTARSHRLNFLYFCYLCPRRYNGRCSVRKHIARQHGVARHLQGPLRMHKWSKDEPPPPGIATEDI